ncbi:MAG: hypothetical protein JW889_07490 [Verrucomicrobia bacterium]|nr:hypothetical protein [Verrucomicrobiota bacterium]
MKWCDYNCKDAAFPEEALEGACRTVAAVWCKRLKKLVPKNSPCQAPTLDREEEAGTKTRGRP